MGFVGRKPTNAPLTSDDIPNGIIGAADLATGLSKLTWVTTVKTSGFTAVANEGYFCNTTSAGFTVTLPATPSAGDEVLLVDYAGTFDTNALTINPNGNKIEGGTGTQQLTGEREGVLLVYIDSTQGWLATLGINEGTDALSPIPYSIDFLVVAGGGGGSFGGGGAGGYRTSTQSASIGTVITVTVGDGGASLTGSEFRSQRGNSGSNSSISGTGLTTITSAGGGGGGGRSDSVPTGANGGSGGGAGCFSDGSSGVASGGTGNTPSTSPSQGNNGGTGEHVGGISSSGGGGGGASANGSNYSGNNGGAGGNGTASSITGSSVTRAGGGGACKAGGGGTGGGGAGGTNAGGTSGTANTGGGGGGSETEPNYFTGAGGKGVVILSVPTASYSSTTTGSPTVTTSGSNTILQFNGSGSYTA